MAAASVSISGLTGTGMEFADYSLYSNLSDDELLQLAIERSIADAHSGWLETESTKTTAAPNRPASSHTVPPSQRAHQQPTQAAPAEPSACPANPPRDPIPDAVCSVRHFITGYGKRMVAYRRYDGSLQVIPEPEEETDPLVKAIWEGDVGTVRLMVKKSGCNLLSANRFGWIPLHEAAFYGQDQCIKILLKAQPGIVNQRTLKDQTALMLAVGKDHLACAEYLLEKGADPDITDKDRETPLYKACEKENTEMVAILLKYSRAVNKNCIQGWTALHEAVCRNNVEICEILMKAGAKINIPNIYGITPIFVAAQSGKVDTLRFLLKNGADLNSQAADGATALYEACKNGHEDIVKFLLSQNADANKPGKTGLLPIHIAAQHGSEGIVSMLIPATSKARVKRLGISPLHLAADRNRDDVLEMLIDAGFNVNAMLSEEHSKMYEDRRSTALYFAVINNNIEATTLLLGAGADPNLDTFNPILVALRQGCIQTVTLLVEHGANVNAYIQTHPTTFPATVMFCMKYLNLLKYLMDHGCDALSCFNCLYGNNPHPPIKMTRNRLDDRHETREKTCVQFCEMISTENFSRWAGPILDVLFDYVGHVKVCSRLMEHLDSYPDWNCIKEKAAPPRPLLQLCRLKIRKLLGMNRLKKIHKLPVPPRLIKFLNHQEREQD